MIGFSNWIFTLLDVHTGAKNDVTDVMKTSEPIPRFPQGARVAWG